MASTRESSPAGESSPSSSPQLTPKSKVKALLAGLDDDSDDEITTSLKKVTKLPKAILPNPIHAYDNDNEAADVEQASEGEEDEEEIVRPKGRLAARMQAREDDSAGEEQPNADARERVKRLLMSKSKSKSPEPTVDENNSTSSAESDTPVTSRKRKIRAPRRETPKSSPPRATTTSPGLFVSPSPKRSAAPTSNLSDSDDLPDPTSNSRFLALVEKKRQELAKAAEITKQKAEKIRKQQAELAEDEESAGSEDEGGRRLTQQTRPTRKASKKALEDINRETQRLARNMQLAYQPKTKKKYGTKDFLAKFGFKSANAVENQLSSDAGRPASSSSAPHSDTEMRETPPTSPASPALDKSTKTSTLSTIVDQAEGDGKKDADELPSLEDLLSRSRPTKTDKGKGKAVDIEEEPLSGNLIEKPLVIKRAIRIRPSNIPSGTTSKFDDSDSDLEIVDTKKTIRNAKLDQIFDRIPAKQANESRSNVVQRLLAHVGSPGKQNLGRNKKPSMNLTDLHVSLQQKARQQATREREERIQALKDKGVILQSAEEREKEMAEVDDLLAKARREGEEIMQREKAAAKKERKANGEEPLGESSDDEEWEEEKGNLAEELSGSGSEEGDGELSEDEDDEEQEEDAMALDEENAVPNPMFDNEAAESSGEESGIELAIPEAELLEGEDENEDDGDEEEKTPVQHNPRRMRVVNIISDDEDEGENEQKDRKASPTSLPFNSPLPPQGVSPAAPTSVLRSATKTFIPGLTVSGPAGLGLTQIFAGTMDESQNDELEGSSHFYPESQQNNTKHDSMAFLRRLPAPGLPDFVPTMEEDSQEIVMDSQTQAPETQAVDGETQGIQINFSQSQIHGFDSMIEDPLASQMSEFPEPTQDVGFQYVTPIKGRFAEPPSTVDTEMLGPGSMPTVVAETPIVKKKGKLRRRAQVTSFSDDEETMEAEEKEAESDFEISVNAFDIMRNATKNKVVVDDFDKKKSEAKSMIHEQAEESEDEYAGLGGASDDESGGEDDAFVKEMIDDEAGKDADESKLAAFFADRERASDEKQVEKLYNDITKGMLRRKRGADYDLSDSDDGGEARQRRKRKEFAKMRKALLADERIGKIAENPKKQAFLRAIEDRGSDDDASFLDDFAEQDDNTDSQSQSQNEEIQQRIPDSQPEIMGSPKRKHTNDTAESRPPPHLRRTKPAKKPSTLSEIRDSLSSLIEDPNSVITPVDSGSDSEDELEIEGSPEELGMQKDKENRDPFALRRTGAPVIDRISLKRQSSNTVSTNTRLAFAHPSSAPGFKVPALLRRATTNNSLASGSTSTSSSVTGVMSGTERMAGGNGSDGVKRGGGKNSGVHYFARESERRAAVVKTEKRREKKRFKGVEVRRKVVGGLFGGGKFE